MDKRIISIRHSVDFIDSSLGLTWLKESLKKIKNAQGGKVSFGCGIDTDTAKTEVAYVAYLWYRAQEEMIVANISGQKFPGPYSLATAIIGSDLETIKHCPGFEQKLSRLKQVDSSKKVIFELSIASGYVRAGFPVTFIDNGFIMERENTSFKCILKTLDSGMDRPFILIDEPNQQQHIVYLYVDKNYSDNYNKNENYLGLINKKVQKLVGERYCTVVVCRAGLTDIGSCQAMIRKGWIYKTTGLVTQGIYVPNESIIPDEC